MRRLSLALTGLYCQSCANAVTTALTLLTSSDEPLPPPIVDLKTASATVVVPSNITDGQVLEAVNSLGPSKSATIVSSQPIQSTANRKTQLPSRSRYERRFRCGCPNLSCCCSKVPVLENDPGVMITVVINNRLLTPGFPTLSLAMSCGSCVCADTEICCCSPQKGDGKSSPEADALPVDEESASAIMLTATDAKSDKRTTRENSPEDAARDNVDANSSQAPEQQLTRALVISGMTCSSCTGTVKDILTSVSSVREANVSFLTSRAILTVSSEEFVLEDALQALRKDGYNATEIQDLKSDKDAVYLRFSTYEVAEKACETLRNTRGVVRADILHLQSSSNTRQLDYKENLVSEGHNITEAEVNSLPDDHVSHRGQDKSRRWASCWTSSRGRNPGDKESIVRLESLDKLEAVKNLESAEFPYDVIPRSDPVLSGSLDTSAILQKEASGYLRLFLGSLIFTIPVALITMIFAKIKGVGAESLQQYVGNSGFRVVDIVAWILATPVQFFFGYRFYRGSWFALKRLRANMDVLIALGTSIAYLFSFIVPVINTIRLRRGDEPIEEAVAFETAAILITIVLFGKWMESTAKKKTAAGVEALVRLAPRTAVVVSPPPKVSELFPSPVDVEFISPGDCVKVNPGIPFPVDGIVIYGETFVDESMLTGESNPVSKANDDQVYAGTVNGQNPVVVRCTSSSATSMLEKIVELVKRAQESRAPIEVFADRVSAYFVPFVVAVAFIAIIVWISLAETHAIPESWYESEGSVVFAVLFGLSVLVIACPCALGLATPTVVMMATSIGARKFGILYKDGGEALQAARRVGTILFDKTGTLTLGKPTVTAAFHVDKKGDAARNVSGKAVEDEISPKLLKIVAIAESFSDHPLAHAITQYCDELCKTERAEVSFIKQESLSGRGIRCILESGGNVEVGSPEWILSSNKTELSLPAQKLLKNMEEDGKSIVLANISGEQLVAFCVEDPIRPESEDVICFLLSKGIRCGIVTGDGRGTALNVARKLHIEEEFVWSRALPAEKMETVRRENCSSPPSKRASGKGVVFVGDGINDAAALSAASVGVAMGSGSQIASENAGIVLTKSNLWDVVIALNLAEVAFRRLKLNYLWALGFNTLGIPIAAGVLYPVLNARLPPYAAAVAMALSSVSVILSSLTLRFYKPPKIVHTVKEEQD